MASVFHSVLQIMSAGANFDGGSPTNPGVYNATFKTVVHAAGVNGGYFVNPFSFATKPHRILFHTDTAVTTFTIYVATVGDVLTTMYSGSTVTDFLSTAADNIHVQPGESLIFLTTGGTVSMIGGVMWDADSDLVS